jgi:hypothetical protein
MSPTNRELANVLAIKNMISHLLTGRLKVGSSRDAQRIAVALCAHAIAAARRDDNVIKSIGGRRYRTLDTFCQRASRFLFPDQTRAQQALYAKALQRIVDDKLDCRTTAALIGSLGLVRFAAGASIEAAKPWKLTNNMRLKAILYLDSIARASEPVTDRGSLSLPFGHDCLILVRATGEHAGAYKVTEDRGRIYAALKAARLDVRSN